MKITVDLFNPKSIDDAIKELERYSNRLESACMELAERLAKLGAQTVENEYRSASEEKQFVVECTQTDNGWTIIAEGENVVFLEFGTGVLTEDYEHPEAVGLPNISPGSYSQTEGRGNFVVGSHEYWYYRKKRYSGTIATHGFYFAKREMKEQAILIAREVFHKWLM